MLSQAGVQFDERDLLKEPLSESEIRSLLNGQPASALYAFRGRQNKLLALDPATMNDDQMIAVMAREPRLIRRPSLLVNQELVAGPSRTRLADLARENASTES